MNVPSCIVYHHLIFPPEMLGELTQNAMIMFEPLLALYPSKLYHATHQNAPLDELDRAMVSKLPNNATSKIHIFPPKMSGELAQMHHHEKGCHSPSIGPNMVMRPIKIVRSTRWTGLCCPNHPMMQYPPYLLHKIPKCTIRKMWNISRNIAGN